MYIHSRTTTKKRRLKRPNPVSISMSDRKDAGTTVAKNKKKKKSKKDAQLVLRLNKDLRNRFVDACQDLDTTAAREVRRFIKRFLKRYDKGELDE